MPVELNNLTNQIFSFSKAVILLQLFKQHFLKNIYEDYFNPQITQLIMSKLGFILFCLQIETLLTNNIQFSVDENGKIGQIIGNIYSKLIPKNSKSSLIKEEEKDSYFSLNKTSGNLIVKSFLDRETICENSRENCTIKFYLDQDIIVTQITIIINDVNDNYPIFQTTQKIINIQENIPLGTTYPLPVAQDKDSYQYGVKTYYILKCQGIDQDSQAKYIPVESQYFQIKIPHYNSMDIYPSLEIIRNIDREEFAQFIFLLVASDAGNQTGTCTVTILVTDVNDNAPEWMKENYKVSIQECQAQGEILDLNAVDRDDSNTKNGVISYRISDRTEDREIMAQIFYINGNKLCLTNNRISGLIKKSSVRLFIVAVDGNGRMNETSVDIVIEDCNDHPPVITITDRYGKVRENEKVKRVLTTVKVKDEDRGRNGMFECSLNDSGKLQLKNMRSDVDMTIYKIETFSDTSFDREKTSVYTVEIKCVDQGSPVLSSVQKFSVNIIDVNDNPPSFQSEKRMFHIVENNPIGSTVGQVSASDPDSGNNGHIIYSILDNNQYFTISNYGEIQSKIKFDREINDTYEFTVCAVDNGDPQLNNSIKVIVKIQDINDCTPIFEKEYFFRVSESYGESIKNERLGQIKATDKDLGQNGTVNYKLVETKRIGSFGTSKLKSDLNRLIRVNFDGGISIYGNLDREEIPSIQLTVQAFDNGHPRLSTTTTIIIEVLDLNDNAPKFLFPDKFKNFINVSLDSEIGKVIGTIQTIDPDQGVNGTVTNTFVNSNKQENFPFKIQPEGEIMVINNLREISSNRRLPERLLIRASDHGKPTKNNVATLYIHYIPSVSTTHQKSARKSIENMDDVLSWKSKNENKNSNRKPYINSNLTESMMVLYSLAAILFFIFIVVLFVLVFIYCSKHYSVNDRYAKKTYKAGNVQLELDTNPKEMKHISKTIRSTRDCETSGNDDASAVCFIGDDGSSYTHLMMLSNSKYTPMIHSTASPGSLRQILHTKDMNPTNLEHNIFNYSDNIITQSTYMPPVSCPAKKQLKSFSTTTSCHSDKETENYSTLKDKIPVDFNSINIDRNVHTISITNHNNPLENSDFCQKQRDFNSPYVTSSFV